MLNKIKIMQSSVEKWNRILAGRSSDGGVLDCPPCRIYYVLMCTGCPISRYTGQKFCKGSPYPAWYWHQNNAHGKLIRRIYCDECRKLATDMRDFMQEVVDHLRAEAEGKDKARGSPIRKPAVPRTPNRKPDGFGDNHRQ